MQISSVKKSADWDAEALLSSALFEPLHPVIASLGAGGFPTLEALNALLAERGVTVRSGSELRFVEQGLGRLGFEQQYEPRCYLNGEVQTRADNLHDLFNALVWLVYPKAKAAINARHFDALQQASQSQSGDLADIRSQRGAVRDTSTLLDESGVIVACADDELADLLKNFQWKELFWHRRAEVQTGRFDKLRTGMEFFLFGHGLYEKALNPYIGMTGQGLLLGVERAFFGWPKSRQLAHLDRLLADYLDDPQHCHSTRELSPVPLLGVPGWAAGNESAAYYDDTSYFRAGRRGQVAAIPERTSIPATDAA